VIVAKAWSGDDKIIEIVKSLQGITHRAYLHMRVSSACKCVDLDVIAGEPH